MALQAIRGEIVSLDAHSTNFYNSITSAETKRRKDAAVNDENADSNNTGASFTPHTPGKSAGLYRYVKVEAQEGKCVSHTRIKMSNGALDLASFQAKKEENGFWVSKSGAPLSVLVFTFDTATSGFADLQPVLAAIRQCMISHECPETAVLVVGVTGADIAKTTAIAAVRYLNVRALGFTYVEGNEADGFAAARDQLFQIARNVAEQGDQKVSKKESAIRELERSGRSRVSDDINVSTPKKNKANRRRSTSTSPPRARDLSESASSVPLTPEQPRRRALTFEEKDAVPTVPQRQEIGKVESKEKDEKDEKREKRDNETPTRRARSPERGGRVSRTSATVMEEEREAKEVQKEKEKRNRDKSVERDRSVERRVVRDRDVSVERVRERPSAAAEVEVTKKEDEKAKKDEEKVKRKEEKKKRMAAITPLALDDSQGSVAPVTLPSPSPRLSVSISASTAALAVKGNVNKPGLAPVLQFRDTPRRDFADPESQKLKMVTDKMHLALDPAVVATRELDNFVLTLPAYIGDDPMLVAEALERAYESRIAESAAIAGLDNSEKKTLESAASRLTTDQRLASIFQRLYKQHPEWHRKENIQYAEFQERMRAFVAHYAKGSYALQREQAADVIPASPRKREAVPMPPRVMELFCAPGNPTSRNPSDFAAQLAAEELALWRALDPKEFVWWLNDKLRATHCPSFSAFSAWVLQLTNYERLVTLGPESDDRNERNRRVAWAVNVNAHLLRYGAFNSAIAWAKWTTDFASLDRHLPGFVEQRPLEAVLYGDVDWFLRPTGTNKFCGIEALSYVPDPKVASQFVAAKMEEKHKAMKLCPFDLADQSVFFMPLGIYRINSMKEVISASTPAFVDGVLNPRLAEQVTNFVTGELTRLKARAMQLSAAGAELDSLIDLKRPAVEIIRATPFLDDTVLEARKDQLTGTGRTAVPFVVLAHGKEKDAAVQWPEKSKSLVAVTEEWASRIRDAWEAAPLREALLEEMCKELSGARQYIRESDRPPFNLLSLAEVLAMDCNSVWENAVYLAFKTIDLISQGECSEERLEGLKARLARLFAVVSPIRDISLIGALLESWDCANLPPEASVMFLATLKSREWARLVFESRLLDAASQQPGADSVGNALKMFANQQRMEEILIGKTTECVSSAALAKASELLTNRVDEAAKKNGAAIKSLDEAETTVAVEREIADSWSRKVAEVDARIKKHEDNPAEAGELAIEAGKRDELEAELRRIEEAARLVREKLNSSKERSAMLQTRMQAKDTKQQQRKERRAEIEKNLPTEEKKKEWERRVSEITAQKSKLTRREEEARAVAAAAEEATAAFRSLTPTSGQWLEGFAQQLLALVTAHGNRVREVSKKSGGIADLKRTVQIVREFIAAQSLVPHKEEILAAAEGLEEKVAKRISKEDKKKREKELQQMTLQADQHEI